MRNVRLAVVAVVVVTAKAAVTGDFQASPLRKRTQGYLLPDTTECRGGADTRRHFGIPGSPQLPRPGLMQFHSLLWQRGAAGYAPGVFLGARRY